MTDEQRLDKLEEEFRNLDTRQTSLETYIKLYAMKTDEQMHIQREELKEMRQDIKAFKVQHSTDIAKLEAKIDSFNQHNQILIGTTIGLSVAILLSR